ncbi:hypothetical protein F4810DRAFT_708261 [Camillea tinctor]|nr:hypothetical protein F4810DRAFT_708261 [Camillea tinctor]
MGLSNRSKAAALAVATLATSVKGQGFYYEDFSAACPPSVNFQYLGCYTTAAPGPFLWTPDNMSPGNGLSKTYIRWETDHVNNTITPHFCTDVCRAHGFKYAALWNQQCQCGATLSYTPKGGALTTLGRAASEADCVDSANPCPGDRRENCGTATGARIFVDPSFENSAAEADLTTLSNGYKQLGCFQSPNLASSAATVTSPTSTFPDTGSCFQYCADLGSPLVYMSAVANGGGAVNCFCGQDFGAGAQSVSVTDNTCSLPCSDVTSTTPCTGQNCCGTGNGPFPVYSNPDLMGCYVPRIPGEADPAVATPAANAYTKCFATPSSITARAGKTRAIDYGGTTISLTGHFVPTAQPSVAVWTAYACYSSNKMNTIFSDSRDVTSSLTDVNVETCTKQCESINFDYAGLQADGTAPATINCICGNTFSSAPLPAAANMQDCNQPCTGSSAQSRSENCGAPGGPLLYARGTKANNGPWYGSSLVSYSSTPIYSCAGGEATTTSTTSTTTSATDSTMTGTDSTMTGTETTTGTETLTTTGTETVTTTGTDTTTSTGTDTTATETETTTGTETITTTGTETTTFTSTGTGISNTTSTTSASVVGVTDLPPDVIVILSVLRGDLDGNGRKRSAGRFRRQAADPVDTSGGFIGGVQPVDPANPDSCNDASGFQVIDGQLLSGGEPVATDTGVDYTPLAVNPNGAISRIFSIDSNGQLHWYNDAFFQGEAGFCQINGAGQVYVTFGPPDTFPDGCVVISIIAYEARQCVNGRIVPLAEVIGTTTTTGGTGTATVLPGEEGIYIEGQAPDAYLCHETTLSFIPGEPTFLPHGEL